MAQAILTVSYYILNWIARMARAILARPAAKPAIQGVHE